MDEAYVGDMATTIYCLDCGEERQARNRKTTYCHSCRLLRNVEFFQVPRRCADCREEFAAVGPKKEDLYCGKHTLGYSTVRGHCAFCKTDDAYLVRPGVACCKECARSLPLRRRLIQGLQKGQDSRRRKNNWPGDTEARSRRVAELLEAEQPAI